MEWLEAFNLFFSTKDKKSTKWISKENGGTELSEHPYEDSSLWKHSRGGVSALLRVRQVSSEWSQSSCSALWSQNERAACFFCVTLGRHSHTQLCKAKQEILIVNKEREPLFLFLSHTVTP